MNAGEPQPLSVLIIEDQSDVAETLRLFLELRGGYDVRVASDGETGLKWAQADPPDAVVCDIGLPRLDGLQVARQIRETVTPCPLLIAVTAYGGTYTQHDALGPFDHYFLKPADPFELAALIDPLGQ